ncbi:UNKNOWN [Stylonychia lemnae]|uniref:Uncharacterized protein n=1 Tax=Stylonychia lemnae TaxID=5949 RepID=A0A077ZUA9_STYLE|nr:UNKNOWN [Stylonychia lemnae]|eukprot:CDW72875.1 UNKNOWN [Stylonychia lemnae]
MHFRADKHRNCLRNSPYVIFLCTKLESLRWCTEKDILAGKGSKICGNKHCDVADQPLHSYEVNMNYQGDNGEGKNVLVKVNLCIDCGVKVNYKRLKDKVKKAKKDKKDKKSKKNKDKKKHKHKKQSNDQSHDSQSD